MLGGSKTLNLPIPSIIMNLQRSQYNLTIEDIRSSTVKRTKTLLLIHLISKIQKDCAINPHGSLITNQQDHSCYNLKWLERVIWFLYSLAFFMECFKRQYKNEN